MVKEIQIVDLNLFHQQSRLTNHKYESLLALIAHLIYRPLAKRKAISPGESLSVTLRYLVTGSMQTAIVTSYRMSQTTFHRITKETNEVILY